MIRNPDGYRSGGLVRSPLESQFGGAEAIIQAASVEDLPCARPPLSETRRNSLVQLKALDWNVREIWALIQILL